MKIFVTGGTGYIGSSVVRTLIAKNHTVIGLARSEKSAQRLQDMGIQPYIGSLEDIASLTTAVKSVEGIIHTAFNYDDWSKMNESYRVEQIAVTAMLNAIANSGYPFIYTSGAGTIGDTGITLADEDVVPNPPPFVQVRLQIEQMVVDAAKQNIRSIVVRPGLIYGRGGSGLVNLLITLAQQARIGRTFGDGTNAWSTVHIDDLAELYALAIEKAPPGSILHAVAGEPIAMREIVAAISRTLGYEGRIEPWAIEEAHQQYGELADSIASEKRLSAYKTKALLDWIPQAPSITDELEHGSYVSIMRGEKL